MQSPLKTFRTDKGLTQAQLAEMLGVWNITVSRWETGRRRIDAAYLDLVAEKTGIPKRDLRPDLAGLLNEVAQ